ncbi:hypothetical protein KY285_036236 [Solanum tuberosum]|nr:hypothetical protein KY285_036236 [Solanum tuberosum]
MRTYYDASQEGETSQGRRGGGRRGGGRRAGRCGLLDEIVERVASASCKDLINLRLRFFPVASFFNEIGCERWVYKKLSLDDVLLKILMRRTSKMFKTYNSFMNVCIDCGNTEAMYRKGMKLFFTYEDSDDAIPLLEKASKGGHTAASYAFAIFSIFLGGEYR